MNITMLRNPSSKYGCKLMEGQTGDVDDKIAEELISAGIAVQVSTAKKTKIEAVPEKPAIKGE